MQVFIAGAINTGFEKSQALIGDVLFVIYTFSKLK